MSVGVEKSRFGLSAYEESMQGVPDAQAPCVSSPFFVGGEGPEIGGGAGSELVVIGRGVERGLVLRSAIGPEGLPVGGVGPAVSSVLMTQDECSGTPDGGFMTRNGDP